LNTKNNKLPKPFLAKHRPAPPGGVRGFWLWLPVILWCGIIYWLSGIPNLKTSFGVGDLILRKCAHMVEYGILYLLARRAFANTTTLQPSIAGFVFAVFYAATDEFHQYFVPTRGPSVRDVIIDSIGAYIARACTTTSGGKHNDNKILPKCLS
jgi:hypothetical protein